MVDSSNSWISGLSITPTVYANSSPIDLVIESPGPVAFTQTLRGPTASPILLMIGSILPPEAKILAASS